AVAACSSAPQTKPANEPATGATATQTPPSPANPPGAATAGTPSSAPPAAGQPATPPASGAAGSAVAQAKPEPPSIDESAMDEPKAETASLQALQSDLKRIDAIRDVKGLAQQVAYLQARGAPALFGFASQQDFKDATEVIGGADQGGLGLPDRDYYLKDDARMKELRTLYQDHVARMLALAGAP